MFHKINGKHVTPLRRLTIWKRIAIGVIADGTVIGIGSVIGGAILVVGPLSAQHPGEEARAGHCS